MCSLEGPTAVCQVPKSLASVWASTSVGEKLGFLGRPAAGPGGKSELASRAELGGHYQILFFLRFTDRMP